ncbi:MAG: adenylyl-sulfate kinase [Polyangiaceae bacterium]
MSHGGSTSSGFVVWFTGLSGSGKSTLATMLAAALRARGVAVELLDGDEVRNHLSRGLGFSREDRDTNIRRIGFVAKLVARAGACAITAAISPYRDVREEQRRAIGRFVEIYCRCPVDVLAERDPKGLYKRALAGEIQHFTGVTDPYEEPVDPELELDTATLGPDAALAAILERLEALGYLAPTRRAHAGYGHRDPVWPAGPRTEAERELDVDAATASALALAARGWLAPVNGALGARDRVKLEKEGRLESGLAFPRELLSALACDASAGATLRLTGPRGPLGIELAIRESDAGLVAGPVVDSSSRSASTARDELAQRGFDVAAGVLARRPIDEELALLVDLGLESRGRLVVLAAGQAAASSALAFHASAASRTSSTSSPSPRSPSSRRARTRSSKRSSSRTQASARSRSTRRAPRARCRARRCCGARPKKRSASSWSRPALCGAIAPASCAPRACSVWGRMQRVRLAGGLAALTITSLAISGPAHAELVDDVAAIDAKLASVAGEGRVTKSTVFLEPNRIYELPRGIADDPCKTVVVLAGSTLHFDVVTASASDDEEMLVTSLLAPSSNRKVASSEGLFATSACGEPRAAIERVLVRMGSQRGTLEIRVAGGKSSITGLAAVARRQAGARAPDVDVGPPMPVDDLAARRARGEARAAATGATLTVIAEPSASAGGTGGAGVLLEKGCHVISVLADGADAPPFDLDVELRDPESGDKLATDRGETPDAHVELCVSRDLDARLVFAGAPANANLVALDARTPLPAGVPSRFGQRAQAGLATGLRRRTKRGPAEGPIAEVVGAAGQAYAYLEVEANRCYFAAVSLTHGASRGARVTASLEGRTVADEAGVGKDAAAVSFCTTLSGRVRLSLDVPGTTLGWVLCVWTRPTFTEGPSLPQMKSRDG